MAQDYTTDTLLSRVKFLAMMPANQSQVSDTEILECAYEQLITEVVPFVVGVRQRYFTREYSFSVVAGTYLYDIPADANVDSFHNARVALSGAGERALTQISASERWQWNPQILRSGGAPYYWYLDGDKIGLLPCPGGSGYTVTLSYDVRQPKLVATSACAQVAFLQSTTTYTTRATIPASFTAYEADTLSRPRVWTVKHTPSFPLVEGLSPALYVSGDSSGTSLLFSFEATSTSVITPTVAGAMYDWVAIYGESPIPFIPAECHSVLYAATAAALLRSYGPSDRYAALQQELERRKATVAQMMGSRVDEAPKRTTALSSLSPGRRWNRGGWSNF